MPELRKDPLSERWVIIAPERADRPNALVKPPPQSAGDKASCPFCPGNESMTPPEIFAQRENGGPWSLRVVPNRYPALRTELVMSREADGPFDKMAGVGAHEVVIETSEHERTLPEFKPEQIAQIFQAWQARMNDLSRDIRLRSVVAFKNHAAPAGATLWHAHSQLVALPIVPPALTTELDTCKKHFEAKERCLMCDLLAHELREKDRVVVETESIAVISPYAARSPFELWLLPKTHGSSFESASGQELVKLADGLRTILRKIDLALEKPAWNLFLHTMPLREPRNDWYHWHLELKPVLTLQAGFEWASGCAINPTPPEEAASFLRQTEV
jgi:UDPglucose--hexose-1-phosphate uridylyltransferase